MVYWHTLNLDMHTEYRHAPHPIRMLLTKLDRISFENKRRVKLAEEIIEKKEAWYFEVSVTDPNFRNAIMLKFGRAFIRMNS